MEHQFLREEAKEDTRTGSILHATCGSSQGHFLSKKEINAYWLARYQVRCPYLDPLPLDVYLEKKEKEHAAKVAVARKKKQRQSVKQTTSPVAKSKKVHVPSEQTRRSSLALANESKAETLVLKRLMEAIHFSESHQGSHIAKKKETHAAPIKIKPSQPKHQVPESKPSQPKKKTQVPQPSSVSNNKPDPSNEDANKVPNPPLDQGKESSDPKPSNPIVANKEWRKSSVKTFFSLFTSNNKQPSQEVVEDQEVTQPGADSVTVEKQPDQVEQPVVAESRAQEQDPEIVVAPEVDVSPTPVAIVKKLSSTELLTKTQDQNENHSAPETEFARDEEVAVATETEQQQQLDCVPTKAMEQEAPAAQEEETFEADFDDEEEEEPIAARLSSNLETEQEASLSRKSLQGEVEDDAYSADYSFESQTEVQVPVLPSTAATTNQEPPVEDNSTSLKKESSLEEPSYSTDADFEAEGEKLVVPEEKKPTTSVDEYALDEFEIYNDPPETTPAFEMTNPLLDNEVVRSPFARSQELFSDILKKPTLKHVDSQVGKVQADQQIDMTKSQHLMHELEMFLEEQKLLITEEIPHGPSPLGRGRKAQVYTAEWNLNGIIKPVAIKEFNFDCSKQSSPPIAVMESFKSELDMLRRVNHFNVVALYGAQLFPKLCIVTELLKEGSLHDCMKDADLWSSISLENKLTVLEDVIHGLEAMHNANLVHRDIKSHNILIQSNSRGMYSARVADLGSTIVLPPGEVAYEEIGSSGWMAPEILAGDTYDNKVDIFAFGMVMWEVLCGSLQNPFSSLDYDRLKIELETFSHLKLPEGLPSGLTDLMQSCLSFDPAERPAISEVLRQLEQARFRLQDVMY